MLEKLPFDDGIDRSRFYEFKGSHYEMGLQQGKSFSKNYNIGFEILRNHEGINNLRPKIIPKKIFMNIAANKTAKFVKPIFDKFAPHQAERIQGISEGSGLPIEKIYLLSGTEIVLGKLDFEIPQIRKGCSDIGYQASKTDRHHAMFSRNFDFEQMVLNFLCLRKNIPNGKYKSWDITASPLPGTFNGVNEKGLAIGTNECFPLNEVEEGLPASTIIQEALENCATTQEAFELIKTLPRGSGNVFLMNDANGDMMAVEYTSKRIYKRQTSDNFLVATNHYLVEELKSIDIPREAVFGKLAPRALQGCCINNTSWIRMNTLNNLVRSIPIISLENMMTFHRDHSADPSGKGNFDTVCHHDPVNITAASMIFDLESLDAWIAFGLPCQHDYIHFKLE